MPPARALMLLFIGAACFFGGYSVGRRSGAASCPAAADAGAAVVFDASKCPAAEPCRCDCQGNPDRKLVDPGPKKAFALPFAVSKDTKYVHKEQAVGGGDNQHRGGDVATLDAAPPPKPMSEGGGGAPLDVLRQGEAAAAAAGEAAAAAAAVAAPKSLNPHVDAAMKVLEAGSGGGKGMLSKLGTPTAGVVNDQCDLPPQFRAAREDAEWASRSIIDTRFLVARGKHAAEHVMAPARVYTTLYPGSRSSLMGNDVWALVERTEYDPHCVEAMRWVFKTRPGSAFIDVGAWIGVATMHAALLGAGSLLALEADPKGYDELWANLRLNPSVAGKTWAYRHCVSDRAEKVTLNGVVGSTSFHLDAWDPKNPGPGEAVTSYSVHCTPLPELAEAHGMAPAVVGMIRLHAAPGMELYIAKGLLDWVKTTPAGAPKPALWITLFSHKWGDQSIGARR
jgi:FkbM family methyltransferase